MILIALCFFTTLLVGYLVHQLLFIFGEIAQLKGTFIFLWLNLIGYFLWPMLFFYEDMAVAVLMLFIFVFELKDRLNNGI